MLRPRSALTSLAQLLQSPLVQLLALLVPLVLLLQLVLMLQLVLVLVLQLVLVLVLQLVLQLVLLLVLGHRPLSHLVQLHSSLKLPTPAIRNPVASRCRSTNHHCRFGSTAYSQSCSWYICKCWRCFSCSQRNRCSWHHSYGCHHKPR